MKRVMLWMVVWSFSGFGCVVPQGRYDQLQQEFREAKVAQESVVKEKDGLSRRASQLESYARELTEEVRKRDRLIDDVTSRATMDRRRLDDQVLAAKTQAGDLQKQVVALQEDLRVLRGRLEETIRTSAARLEAVKRKLAKNKTVAKASRKEADGVKPALSENTESTASDAAPVRPEVSGSGVISTGRREEPMDGADGAAIRPETPLPPAGIEPTHGSGKAVEARPSAEPARGVEPRVSMAGAQSPATPKLTPRLPVKLFDSGAAASPFGQPSVNRGSLLDLMRAGFSDTEAGRILSKRPYRDWEDVRRRGGVTPGRLEELKQRATLD